MREVVVPQRLQMSLAALGDVGRRWLLQLPELVAGLAAEWGLAVGSPLDGGNASYVVNAETEDGRPVVLKIAIPAGVDGFTPFAHELEALAKADGDPYVELLNSDAGRQAALLERLGGSLASMRLGPWEQIEAITATVARGWRRIAPGDLPSGDEKARWLADFVVDQWEQLHRPCSEAAIRLAAGYAQERAKSIVAERCVLVHGDAHPHNVLQAGVDGGGAPVFKLIDPEGLYSEPAHDLGVVLRHWNEELLAGDTTQLAWWRCQEVAARTGIDAASIWQWSFIERMSTGLFLQRLGHQQQAVPYLHVADRLATSAKA